MVETLCTSGAVKLFAGVNANSTIMNSGAAMTTYITFAEGALCRDTRVNWISAISSVSADLSGAVAELVAKKAAIDVVDYDHTGYLNVAEAVSKMNSLSMQYANGVKTLGESKVVTALGATYF